MGTIMQLNSTLTPGSGGGGGYSSSLLHLIEKEIDVLVMSGESKYVPIPIGYDKYDIRTLLVTNDKDSDTSNQIYDKMTGGIRIYKSLNEKSTYDILNIPCIDKDGSKTCHLYVENLSATHSTYKIILKATILN